MDEKGIPPPYSGPEQGYQGYPQQGYPPPQQGYQSQGYQPTQGYPVPQFYPPQGYPPQGYPPQGYPTQAYPPQDYSQTQGTTNVVVVQPSPAITTVTQPYVGDYYLTMSIIVTVMCFMCVGIPSLVCTIPAIFLSLAAKEEALRGNTTSAQQKGNMSLGLNIAAVVCGILFYVVIIGLIVGISSSSARSYNGYYG